MRYMKSVSFSRVFLLSYSEEQGPIESGYRGNVQAWEATRCARRRAFIVSSYLLIFSQQHNNIIALIIIK